MKTFVIVLLVVLAAVALIGFLVEALLWLALVAAALLVGAIVVWRVRSRIERGSGTASPNS